MSLLEDKYKQEGISPDTGAFCLIDGKIYMTVAGMEIKAMRSGVLAGKSQVIFGPETDAENPFSNKTINVPTSAVATYSRLIMDQPREFSSDPVQFFEYAKKRWHFEKPFMFLSKIARACALRHAFPDILAGVISSEEMQCELGFEQAEPMSNPPALPTQEMLSGFGVPPIYEAIKNPETNRTIGAVQVNKPSVHDLVASVFKKPGAS